MSVIPVQYIIMTLDSFFLFYITLIFSTVKTELQLMVACERQTYTESTQHFGNNFSFPWDVPLASGFILHNIFEVVIKKTKKINNRQTRRYIREGFVELARFGITPVTRSFSWRYLCAIPLPAREISHRNFPRSVATSRHVGARYKNVYETTRYVF